ncbi:type I restriction enzyme S subunit [Pantoea ananatis]
MVELMVSEQQSGTAGKGVPAGFKLTEVGVIPEDWDVYSLGELSISIASGKTSTQSNGEYPLYGSTGLIGTCKSGEYEGNALLIARVGANAGRLNFVTGEYGVSDNTLIVKIKPQYNISLFYYILLQKNLNSLIFGSGQPLITGSLLKKIIIAVPGEDEQNSIANVLIEIDTLIIKLEKLLSKKQAIKTATMQQLLTGKTRLPQFVLWEGGVAKGYKKSELGDIPEDWVVTNIGQFTDCCAGGTPSTKILAYWGGIHPWMSSGELHLKQVYAVADYITDEGLVNSSTKYVPKNSVLVGLAGQGKTRGTVAINRIELCTNQSIAAIFPSENHSTDFLFYNLGNRYEELRSLSTGDGGRGGLNLTIIRKVHIVLPPKEEQIAIAAILSDMDKEIQILQQRLDKTRQLKQGMMQELLTGKIRLIERN